jgi:hypothetical protein
VVRDTHSYVSRQVKGDHPVNALKLIPCWWRVLCWNPAKLSIHQAPLPKDVYWIGILGDSVEPEFRGSHLGVIVWAAQGLKAKGPGVRRQGGDLLIRIPRFASGLETEGRSLAAGCLGKLVSPSSRRSSRSIHRRRFPKFLGTEAFELHRSSRFGNGRL